MNLDEIKLKAASIFQGLSFRERLMIGSTIMLGVVFLTWELTAGLVNTFDLQERKIKNLESNSSLVWIALEKYEKLSSRLKSMEQNFRKGGPPGGMRSYLEESLKNKAGVIAPNFTIKAGTSISLGENYSKYPFTVTFSTTSIGKIVDFLEDLANADANLLITKLDIQKGRMAEKLSVVIDVSNIANAER